MTYTHANKGVCSLSTEVTIEDGIIENVSVVGGCNGNLKGLCTLLKGMDALSAVERLRGITCKDKKTSCPDQIAIAIEEALAQ